MTLMSSAEIENLFQKLWEPYYRQNPQVPEIYRLIQEREKSETLYNDHIALRTYQHPRVGLDVLAQSFTALGFVERESFHLTDKHVFAKYYTHPSGQWPRVFISELLLDSVSGAARELIDDLVQQVPQELIDKKQLVYSGRPWSVSHQDYLRLLEESDYASWMAAHGFQMNHATLSVNALQTFETLEELNEFLKSHGFTLNGQDEGREIQAATDVEGRVILKQASVIAREVPVEFSDGTFDVPACYYEFLQRFHGYDSFDPGSASKIMESTNVRR